jgi:hypothetical protein
MNSNVIITFILCFVMCGSTYTPPITGSSTLCRVHGDYWVEALTRNATNKNITVSLPLPICASPVNTFEANLLCIDDLCSSPLFDKNWVSETWLAPIRPGGFYYNQTKEKGANITAPEQVWFCLPKLPTQCWTKAGLPCYDGSYSYAETTYLGDQSYHQFLGQFFIPGSSSISGRQNVAKTTSGFLVSWRNHITEPICPTAVARKKDYLYNLDCSLVPSDTGTVSYQDGFIRSQTTQISHPLYTEDFNLCETWGQDSNEVGNQTLMQDLDWGINYDYVDMSTCVSSYLPAEQVFSSALTLLSIYTPTWNQHDWFPPQDSTCVNVCAGSPCDGDSSFTGYIASGFGPVSTTSTASSCYCRFLAVKETWWYQLANGTKIPALPIRFETTWTNQYLYDNVFNWGAVKLNLPEFAIQKVLLGYDVNSTSVHLQPALVITVRCHPNLEKTTLTVPCTEDVVVNIQFANYFKVQATVDSILVVEIPTGVLQMSGDMLLLYYQGSTLVGQDTLPIIGKTSCEMQDCTFCFATLSTFACQPTSLKIAVVVVLVVMIALTLIVAGWACYCIAIIGKVIWFTIYNTCRCVRTSTSFIGSGFTSAVNATKEGFTMARSNVFGDSTVTSTVTTTNPPYNRVPTSNNWFSKDYLVILFIVFVMTNPVMSSCYGGVSVQSVISTCTKTTTRETCRISTDLLLSIPFSHVSACYNVMNEENSTVMGTIEVKYVEQVNSIDFVNQYVTSGWDGFLDYSKSCWTPTNWCGDRCRDMLPDDYDGYGQLSDSAVTTYPGMTSCSRTCGCAGCGCFYCDDACTVTRWAVHPKAPFATIYTPSQQRFVPYVQVIVTESNVVTSSSVLLMRPGITQIALSNYVVSLVGTLSTPSVGVGSKYLRIDDNGVVSLTDAAPPNSPQPGVPGDIQGPSATFMLNVFLRKTIRVSPLLHIGGGFQSPGVLLPGVKLPGLFNNRYWIPQGTQIYCNETESTPILLHLTTPNPVTFTRTIVSVCPKMSIIAISGCFACPFGFTVNVSASSTCLSGSAVFSGDSFSVTESAIYLTQIPAYFLVHCSSVNKALSGVLKLSSGIYHSDESLSATLDDYTNFTPEGNFTVGVVSNEGTSDPWTNFSDFLSNIAFGSWLNGILSFLIIAIGIIVVYKLLSLLMSTNCRSKTKML